MLCAVLALASVYALPVQSAEFTPFHPSDYSWTDSSYTYTYTEVSRGDGGGSSATLMTVPLAPGPFQLKATVTPLTINPNDGKGVVIQGSNGQSFWITVDDWDPPNYGSAGVGTIWSSAQGGVVDSSDQIVATAGVANSFHISLTADTLTATIDGVTLSTPNVLSPPYTIGFASQRTGATIDDISTTLPGLIAHYPLDGDGTDHSGFDRNLNLYDTTTVTGHDGSTALEFDGATSYAHFEGNVSTSNPFTWALWFKIARDAPWDNAVVINQGDAPDATRISPSLRITPDLGLVFGTYAGGGYDLVTPPHTVFRDKWHFVAIRSGANGDRELWLDGRVVATGTAQPFGQVLPHFYLGSARSYGYHHMFKGAIDEVRIYNRAVSDAELEALGALSVGRIPTGLIAHYNCEADGFDDSGYGKDAPTFDVTPVEGVHGGNGLQFNGSTSYLRFNGPMSTSNPFTWACWLKLDPNAPAVDATVLNQGGDPNKKQISPLLMINKDLGLRFGTYAGVGGYEILSPTHVIQRGNWHFVAVTGNADGDGTMWLDGQIVATTTSQLFGVNLPNFYAGGAISYGYHQMFKGVLDDIRVYNRDLSPTELQIVETGGHVGPPDTDPVPNIELVFHSITDTSGERDTESPGVERSVFSPGEAVRITLWATNTGGPASVQTVLNLRGPDDSTFVYDSHDEDQNSTADSPLLQGETDYYSFDWVVPADAEFGSYDVLASIRDQFHFDTTYDTTEPGPGTGFDGDYVIDDAFNVYVYPQGTYDVDIDEFSNSFGSLELTPFWWNSRGLWDWVVDLSWAAPAGCRVEVWATAYNRNRRSDPILWISNPGDGNGRRRYQIRPEIPGDDNTFAVALRAFIYAADDPRNIPLASDSAILTIPQNLPPYLPAASRPLEPAPALVIRDIQLLEEGGFPTDPQELHALYMWYLLTYQQEREDLLEMVDDAQVDAIYGAAETMADLIPLGGSALGVFAGRYDLSSSADVGELISDSLFDIGVWLFDLASGKPFLGVFVYACESTVSVNEVYERNEDLQLYGIVLEHLQSQFTAPFVTASDGAHADRVVVQWTPVTNASPSHLYSIYRGPDSDFANALPIAGASGLSYEDTDMAVGQTYFYWIKAFLDDGSTTVLSPDGDSGYATENLIFIQHDVSGPGTGAGTPTTFNTNDTVPSGSTSEYVTVGAGTRHHCIGHHGTGDAPSSNSHVHDSFTITQSSELVWLWDTEHLLELAAGTGGTLVTPASSWRREGSLATIEAMANSGYRFGEWSDPGVSNANSARTNVIMDSGRNISASFIKTWELTATAQNASQGDVDGGGTYDTGTNAEIEASPEPGWRFGGWAGGGIADPTLHTTTVLMDQNRTVTASFLIDSTDGYNGWSSIFGGETDINRIGPLGDFDGDGDDNFLEYAFVTNALHADPADILQHSVTEDGGDSVFELTFKVRSDDPDLGYGIRWGQDPGSLTRYQLSFDASQWSTNVPGAGIAAATNHGDGTWSLGLRLPMGAAAGFVQLEAVDMRQ